MRVIVRQQRREKPGRSGKTYSQIYYENAMALSEKLNRNRRACTHENFQDIVELARRIGELSGKTTGGRIDRLGVLLEEHIERFQTQCLSGMAHGYPSITESWIPRNEPTYG